MLYNRTFLSFLTVIGGFPVPQLVIVCTTANSQSIPFLPLLATISLDDHFFRASSIYSSAKYYWAPTVCWALCKVLEKAVAPHSSTLAWKIPWTEDPGGLQSIWSLRVGHDLANSLSVFTFMHWRRKWQPTPVFLPGESQGWWEPGGLPSMGSHRVGHD